ncbi:MAG: tetratricopeptide repeat protein [SAR324 cluster bacterium]
MAARTHYEVLQIDPQASQEVIQGAYRALLKNARVHPDLGGDAARAAVINEAYAVLSDPERRAAYDRDLSRGRRGAPGSRAAPEPEAPGAAAVRTQYILICPNCRKRNLVRAEETLQAYTCGACHHVLLPEKRSPLETDPQRAFRLGLFLFDRRMTERARHEFQLAVKLKPGNALYQFWLGRSCYDSHLFERARQAFHAAVTIRPGQHQFHFWLGQAAARLKRLDEATAAYRRALELRPGHAATVLRLATCYFRARDYGRSAALLSEAAAGHPLQPDLHLLLGMTRLAQGDRRAAAAALQAALRLKPGDTTIARYLEAMRKHGPLPGLHGLWRRLRGTQGAA